MKYLIIIIFVASYILFFALPKRRAITAISAALILSFMGAVTGTFTLAQAFRAINWNVMGIFIGTLFLADIFTYSRAPAVLAENIVRKTHHAGVALLGICVLSSIISAFVENVATVLIVAPIALAICKKIKVSPVAPIIGIAISSNLQGTATLIGDPPSMLLAGYAKLSFNDFFIYRGRPGIFFAVQVGAVFSFLALWMPFRKYKQNVQIEKVERVRYWTPVTLMLAMILLLAISSFINPEFSEYAGLICLILGILGLLWFIVDRKKSMGQFIKKLDWDTAFFLIGVFILVGSLEHYGWIERFAGGLANMIGEKRLLAFSIIVLGSVAISAVVDNVPYLAAMIPVAQRLADGLEAAGATGFENRTLLMFGLLVGSCLGGNITPVGAAANIVGAGILKKRGHDLGFWEFVKIGLPFTLAAVFPAAIFLWLVWA